MLRPKNSKKGKMQLMIDSSYQSSPKRSTRHSPLIREFKKLRRQLQRKRHIKIELYVKL